MHDKELATKAMNAFLNAGCNVAGAPKPRASTAIDSPRRQYLFQHENGTVEVFTAIAKYRDGEVTLTDVQDHRWVMPVTGSRVHWVDQIHDHVGGDW